MEAVNKQICRLCLEVIPSGNCEVIQEINKEKLEVLLININFDISDDAIACDKCLEKLQDCYDFKSTCFYMDNYIVSSMNVDVKVDMKAVFEKEMSKESVNLGNVQMCWLCMSLIKDESFCYSSDFKDDFFLKDMFRNCLLKMDLNTAHIPLICNRCLSRAKKYGEFIKTCHDVEERIKNYCQIIESYGIGAKVILEDIYEFENRGTLSKLTVIKKECLNVENEDMTVIECFKGEDTACIKCEEVDIKDELYIGVETSEAVRSGNCNNSGINGSPKRKRCVKTEEKQRSNSSQEVQDPQGVPMYKCQNCNYENKLKCNLKYHMRSHYDEYLYKFRFSTLTKVFECLKCTYETDNKLELVQHFLKHKWKTETYMCLRCPFKSKCKYMMVEHRKMQHGKNAEVYKCKDCSYGTGYKNCLTRHQLLHKNPEDIPKHKCEKCEYRTKYKHNLMLHMLVHDDSAKFKCEKCPYQSKRQPDVKRHMLTHFSEKLYSCELCTYSSPVHTNLRQHMFVHQTDCKKATIRCNQCDFQTKHMKSLWRHMQRHDPTRPTLQCDKCEYRTIEKYKLKNHQVRHMELGDTTVYYCATCNFKTKYKHTLSNHMVGAKKCLKTRRLKSS